MKINNNKNNYQIIMILVKKLLIFNKNMNNLKMKIKELRKKNNI